MRQSIVLAVTLAACDSGPSEQDKRLAEFERVARVGPHHEVTMFELAREYRDNQFNADARYKGKGVRVSGQVSTLLVDNDGNPMISLGPGRDSNLVVGFWSGSRTRLQQLAPGDGIELSCVGGGMAANQMPTLIFCDDR